MTVRISDLNAARNTFAEKQSEQDIELTEQNKERSVLDKRKATLVAELRQK